MAAFSDFISRGDLFKRRSAWEGDNRFRSAGKIMRTKTYGYQLLLALLSALAVASCSTPPIETMARARVSSAFAEAPQERPGLGTKWGETRKSATSATTFERATPNQPVATAEIF